RVRAGDEEEFVSRILGTDITQRIHRVRLSATIDVDPADRETEVRGGSHHSHQITILGHRYSATRLLPGLAGRNENDLIQPEPRLHLAGGNEVTMVNRVEGAAHDADAT